MARVMDSKKLQVIGKTNKKQKFGMDLVGEADEAGFAFPKNAKIPHLLCSRHATGGRKALQRVAQTLIKKLKSIKTWVWN